MLARGILGSGRTGSVSSRPFPNSSGWWWLISSVFLIRISCHKTTHANGYYGSWPGWAVSISVLPLTTWVNLVWGKEIQNQFSIISTFVLLLLVFLVRLLWIFIKSGFISCENPHQGGHGNPLQYSRLENPMDRGSWWATYSPWGCKESDTTEHRHGWRDERVNRRVCGVICS